VSAGIGQNDVRIVDTYDISVKSNGCYKAEAPPTSVGNLLIGDTHGHNVVNPVSTIYGCFNTS
jgi:hypothetical protein